VRLTLCASSWHSTERSCSVSVCVYVRECLYLRVRVSVRVYMHVDARACVNECLRLCVCVNIFSTSVCV
jgi:hypothetical protein